MKVYNLKREMELDIPVNEAWKFFSDPMNLAKICPPEMKFKVLTNDLPERIYSGLMINYSVTPLLGLEMKWLTEIKHVKEPFYFIDEQRSGPYSLWYHEHTFIERGNRTLMKDEVHYSLPFSVIGNLSHSLFVRKKIESIFDYRKKVISTMFKQN